MTAKPRIDCTFGQYARVLVDMLMKKNIRIFQKLETIETLNSYKNLEPT